MKRTTKRISKKLTSKQANKISLTISFVYLLLSVIHLVTSDITGDEFVFALLIGCITGALLCYIVVYFFLFNGEEIEREERYKNTQQEIMDFLTVDQFTELSFIPKNNYSETEMISGILKKEGCRFWAKLDENTNIILIVKDKNDDIVWESNIENHEYFHSKFKKL